MLVSPFLNKLYATFPAESFLENDFFILFIFLIEFIFDSGDLCHIITFLSTELALKPKVLNIYSLVRDASTFVVLFFNFKVICSLFSGILCVDISFLYIIIY